MRKFKRLRKAETQAFRDFQQAQLDLVSARGVHDEAWRQWQRLRRAVDEYGTVQEVA